MLRIYLIKLQRKPMAKLEFRAESKRLFEGATKKHLCRRWFGVEGCHKVI